jgi:membrane protein DedA with SNARE-associated domain
MNFGPSAP